MKSENAFVELDFGNEKLFPDIQELSIVSGGCRLYGYMLIPDKRYQAPYPTIIMSHGFPGYTTNNDLEYALMRTGCVVIHVNHRGAWGSEGNYLFTNLKEDMIAIAKWAHNPAIAERYNIDVFNIFLIGHSMGGSTVLNAAKELPFLKGVVALAPYDIGAAFRYKMEKDLFNMIETEGQCLKMTSVSAVYENAVEHQKELALVTDCEKLREHNILLIEGLYDPIAPPDKMIKPLADKLNPHRTCYIGIKSNHSFVDSRIEIAKIIARWLEARIAPEIDED